MFISIHIEVYNDLSGNKERGEQWLEELEVEVIYGQIYEWSILCAIWIW